MGLEKVGTQFRIRVRPPAKFSTLRTKDVGRKGGLQLIIGRLKGRVVTTTQSFRVSTKDFKRVRSKLVATTSRGMKEARSLKKKKRGPIGAAIKRYF